MSKIKIIIYMEMPMANDQEFTKASQDVKNLKSKPSNDVLLNLYSLFKQVTEGDVQGSRPGMLDIKGRAKYDAWAKLKGNSKDIARGQYVQLVKDLLAKN